METAEGIQLRDFALEPAAQHANRAESPPPKPTTFWSKYIRITIPETACRDHLALERTYLAYVRTASAYAQFGVTLAQLFKLNSPSSGTGSSTTSRIAAALGATTEGVAVCIVLIGAAYFVKQQKGIVEGIVLSRGWEIVTIVAASVILFGTIFGLLLTADKW